MFAVDDIVSIEWPLWTGDALDCASLVTGIRRYLVSTKLRLGGKVRTRLSAKTAVMSMCTGMLLLAEDRKSVRL